MIRWMCKSKIHRIKVTDKDLNYKGSIMLDCELLNAADITPGEMLLIVNANNGNRWNTYAIAGKSGSGVVSLNGGSARLGEKDDELFILSYSYLDQKEVDEFRMKVVFVDKSNKITKVNTENLKELTCT